MSQRFQFGLRAMMVAVLLTGAVCGLLRLLLDQEEMLVTTNDPLDVAIDGDGFFFAVADTKTKAARYTRSANLVALDSNGQLQPPLSLPLTNAIVVTAEGAIWMPRAGKEWHVVGQLQLATFANPKGLLKVGENLYQETSSSGPPLFGRPGDDGFGCTVCQNLLWEAGSD